MMCFSPSDEFDGESVFLTGGLGFLGSVVLEKLLRCTNVKKVYLLVRSKRDKSAPKRVEQLLCSSLFNMLHDDALTGRRNVFGKVEAVEGDLSHPELGLSATDMQMLHEEVSMVVHCAANIELDAQIHWTLKNNYCGTRELMKVAGGMTRLKCFLHTSTYFVNNFLPRHAVAPEKIQHLPLTINDAALSHAQLVSHLLALDAAEADKQVAELMQRLNFNSTYAFGKYLTELLVDDTTVRPGVNNVIVRPSLISGLAGDPYPGFVTGYGGPGGYTMGYAAGFFQGVNSIAYRSDYMMDLIPVDTVAALVIAGGAYAAAAHSTPAAVTAARPTTIFHAASAQSHPLTLRFVLETSAKFWSANPPPLVLPLTKYVTFQGKHMPTTLGIQLGRIISWCKIWVLGAVLRLLGKEREARLLSTAFKAFSVYNSPRYDRSIISSVDNVRQLMDAMAEAERDTWRCLWLPSDMSWSTYGNTFFAGIRRLLFRIQADSVMPEPHLFKYRSGVAPSVLSLPVLSAEKLEALSSAANCKAIHLSVSAGFAASACLPEDA
eukprot:gene7405-7614_t